MFKRSLSLFCVLLLLSGCQALGLSKPGNFNGNLAYATATATGVLDTVTQEVSATRMSSDDGQALIGIAENSKAFIDSARRVQDAGDPATAAGKLELSTKILEEIRDYLKKD